MPTLWVFEVGNVLGSSEARMAGALLDRLEPPRVVGIGLRPILLRERPDSLLQGGHRRDLLSGLLEMLG